MGRSRQAVEKQRRSSRMLALRSGRRWRYPVWQLDADEPGGLVPGVVEVLERLPLSPAGVALWLTTANPELDGETPIQVLRNRQTDRVRLVKATIRSPIPVLDLVGLAARSVGLTQEIAATTDYVVCQTWARAFYDQYPNVQGIRWRGRPP